MIKAVNWQLRLIYLTISHTINITPINLVFLCSQQLTLCDDIKFLSSLCFISLFSPSPSPADLREIGHVYHQKRGNPDVRK